jgi:hypothetical protein
MAQHENLDLLRPLRVVTQDKQLEQAPQHPVQDRDDDPSESRYNDRRPTR